MEFLKFLNAVGSWKVLGLGIGAVIVGAAASFVSFEREYAARGKGGDERRARWRDTGRMAMDLSFTGAMLALLAVVAMVVRWAVT